MIKEFSKLSEDQIKKLNDFVNSPYFNKSQNVVRLFSYLNSKYPNISDQDLNIKKISKSLVKEGKISEVYCRKIISQFNSIFEEFLINEEHKKDEIRNGIKLLKALRLMRSEKQFLKNHKKYSNKNKLTLRNGDYYMNEINLILELISLDISNTYKKNYSLFQDTEDNIDLNFVIHKIHYFYTMKGVENYHLKKIYKMTFKDEVFKFIEDNERNISESHPYIYLEYLALKMTDSFKESDEVKFIEYFQSLEINKNTEEYVTIYLFKLEYLYKVGHLRKLDFSYRRKTLGLYRWAFDNGYFKHFLGGNGYLHQFIYFSIIITFLENKEIAWTSNFIEETKTLLDPNDSVEMYNLGRAKLSFARKNFDDCFLYLNRIKLNDPYYYFEVKITTAKILYERGQYESAGNIITGMDKYYKKNKKIAADIRNNFKAHLTVFRKLIKYSSDKKYREKNGLPYFKEEIKKYKTLNVHNNSWYLEMSDKIK